MTFDTSPKSGCEYAVTFKKDFVFFKEGREEETKARAKASTYELHRMATIVSRSGVNFGSHQISFDLDKNAVFEVSSDVFNYLTENPLHDLCMKVDGNEICPIFLKEERATNVRESKEDHFVLNIRAMNLYNVRFVNTLEEGFHVRFGS